MRLRLTRRRIIIALVLVIVGAMAVFALLPDPIEVEVAVVDVGSLAVVVREDGRTRTVDRYQVTAPVAGRLGRIAIREGDAVAQGDALARIQPAPLDERTRTQLEAQAAAAAAREGAARSAAIQARAAREQAVRELERRRRLAEQGAMSAEALERFELALTAREEEAVAADQALRAAEAEVAAARAALIEAGVDQEGGAATAVTIRAPAAGTVLRIPERSARIVAPGEPLLEIGDASKLEVVVDVLSSDAARMLPAMPARIEGWGGAPLDARVARVEPAAFTRVSALGVEEQRVNVLLDFVDAPPASIGDGYRVEASITIWSADNVLTAPAAALFRAGEGWRAFVLMDDQVRLRDVTVGERGGENVQITGGLEPGDRVVLFPSDDLTDGTSVRALESGGA